MPSLLPSTTATVSTAYPIGRAGDFRDIVSAAFLLTVSAAHALVGDTFDAYLQHSVDGTTWDDFVHFTQVLGNGGAKKFLAFWQGRLIATTPLKAPAAAGLAAGVQQGPVGGTWQLSIVIVDGGAHGQSFTFALDGDLVRQRG